MLDEHDNGQLMLNSNIDDDHAFSQSQETVLLTIIRIESFFSLISSMFIVISYFKFKSLQKFSFTLVLFLSLSDMGCCCSYLMGNPKSSSLCTMQGIIQSFFELASLLWVTVIAYTLFRKVILQRDSKQDLCKYACFCFGLSTIAALLPLTTNSYGSAGGWCWITTSSSSSFLSPGNLWRFSLFYFPLWTIIFFNGFTYVWVIKAVQRLMRTQPPGSHSKYDKMLRRLKSYPFILCCCWAGATINRFQNVLEPNNPIFALFVLQVSTRSLQGILNAVAYGFTSPVVNEWSSWWGKEESNNNPDEKGEEEDSNRKPLLKT